MTVKADDPPHRALDRHIPSQIEGPSLVPGEPRLSAASVTPPGRVQPAVGGRLDGSTLAPALVVVDGFAPSWGAMCLKTGVLGAVVRVFVVK